MTVQRVIPVNEELREIDKLRNRRGWKYAMEQGRQWCATEHEFVLMRGDANTGRTMRMLGRDAKRLNREYEQRFIKALDTNPAARMYRWKWNELMPEGQKVIKSKGRHMT